MNFDKLKANRLNLLDIARALALILMTLYHLTWDLSYFSYLPPQTATSNGFAIFARIVATSFLMIAGFSLYLAYREFINMHKFAMRMYILIFSALLITTITYFIMPDNLIYFGILHQIALTSVIGLLFLHTPIFLNIAVMIAVFFAPFLLIPQFGSSMALNYIGLSATPRPSLDYVPFFPWFSAGLLGITLARIMEYFNWLRFLRYNLQSNWLNSGLKFLGQHSLIYYLIHQPIIFGLVYFAALYMPPNYAYLREPMEKACIVDCETNDKAALCRNYCSCFFQGLEEQKLLKPFYDGKISIYDEKIYNRILTCRENASVSD